MSKTRLCDWCDEPATWTQPLCDTAGQPVWHDHACNQHTDQRLRPAVGRVCANGDTHAEPERL